MKSTTAVVIVSFLFAAILPAQEKASPAGGASYLVVKITDHKKEDSYKVMTRQEYYNLGAEIAEEGRCWDKALSATEKEWKSNPDTSKKIFPRNLLCPKRITISHQFEDANKAAEKVQDIEKRRSDQAALDKQREDAKKNPGTVKGPDGTIMVMMTQKPASVTKAEKAKQSQEDQRNALQKKAVELFEVNLAKAVSQAGTAPAKR